MKLFFVCFFVFLYFFLQVSILNDLKVHIWHPRIEDFQIFVSLHEFLAFTFECNTEYVLRKERISES